MAKESKGRQRSITVMGKGLCASLGCPISLYFGMDLVSAVVIHRE